MGHQRMIKQNVRSATKNKPVHSEEEDLKELNAPISKTHHLASEVIALKGEASFDLTGRFPIKSGRGCKCIMCFYDFDSNLVNAQPLKSRTKGALVGRTTNITLRA